MKIDRDKVHAVAVIVVGLSIFAVGIIGMVQGWL